MRNSAHTAAGGVAAAQIAHGLAAPDNAHSAASTPVRFRGRLEDTPTPPAPHTNTTVAKWRGTMAVKIRQNCDGTFTVIRNGKEFTWKKPNVIAYLRRDCDEPLAENDKGTRRAMRALGLWS